MGIFHYIHVPTVQSNTTFFASGLKLVNRNDDPRKGVAGKIDGYRICSLAAHRKGCGIIQPFPI